MTYRVTTDSDESKSSQRPTATDRRTVLSRIGGAAGVASLTGVAGCTSLFGGDPLTVAFGPSFRTLQAPVMDAQGYLDELDASVEVKNYRTGDDDDGWGFSDDAVEVRFMDVTWAIKSQPEDVGKIVAANNRNDCVLLAGEEFARAWNDDGPDAFATFYEQNEGPFEVNSADMTRAKVWLDAVGVPREQLEWDGNAHVPSIRREFRDGDVDGAFLSEPTLTELARTDVALEEIAWVGSAVSNLPGGVVTVRDELREDQPGLVKELLEKHVEATEDLNERPREVAPMASNAFGDELSTAVAEAALEKRTADFVTDPRPMTEELNALADILAEKGILDEPISADSLVEPSFYPDVA